MPTPPTGRTGASWTTYAPGQMPRGRLVEASELSGIADRGLGAERLYLPGSFSVTASGENRAVLRTNDGAVRIIVEFPRGMRPPAEGSSFDRNLQRPFLITDVRKGADGQINVYAREVTSE